MMPRASISENDRKMGVWRSVPARVLTICACVTSTSAGKAEDSVNSTRRRLCVRWSSKLRECMAAISKVVAMASDRKRHRV